MANYSEEIDLHNSVQGHGRTMIFLRELFRDVDIGIHDHEIGSDPGITTSMSKRNFWGLPISWS